MKETTPLDEPTIFAEALALPPDEREAFLDRACRGDAGLRARVDALLAAEDKAEAFMETAPGGPRVDASEAATEASSLATDFRATATERPSGYESSGDRIGRYKLLQRIGEGGFGTVWMAEQSEPVERRVALKIIKAGMDTREVIARFEAERRALAMMDHPNIATVLDAGATETGRPFFVMELVKGVPVTTFCDERKLDTRGRLDLFREICAAVSHAHQKGIIHRDLKPSNILVTLHGTRPVPKIIDFGIAKATQGKLTDKTLFTRFEQFVGTPVYMSPEQAVVSGLDVDTRCDIYSLGVLLYELLTGRPPFDPKSLVSAGYDEMRRIIREEDPPKPSTRLQTLEGDARTTVARTHAADPGRIGRFVRGDLDWIVMKAIEKDRARRYGTADAFARDIERFLADEPVEAAAPSAAYRFRKFTRRHRTLVWATGAIAAVLVVATLVSLWQAAEAREARRVTEMARSRAEQVIEETNEALVGELRAIGKLDLLDGVAEAAAGYFDLLPEELRSPESDRLRASVLENRAAVLADRNEITAAADTLADAVAVRRGLLASDPVHGRRGLANALLLEADLLEARGDLAGAAERLEDAIVALRGKGGNRDLADLMTGELETLASVHQAACQLQARRPLADGPTNAEESSFAAFTEAVRHLLARDDFETTGELLAAESVLERGDLAMASGDHARAARRFTEATTLFTELLAARPDDTRIRESLAVAFDRLGDAASAAGDREAALASYRRYAHAMRALAAHDPDNTEWRRELSVALNECGDTMAKLGDRDGARDCFSEALQLRRALAEIDPDHADAQYELASSLFRLGEVAFEAKDAAAAVECFAEAAEIAARAAGPPGAETRWIERRLGSLQRLAVAHVMRRGPGDLARAVTIADQGGALASTWESHPDAGALRPRNASAAFRQLAEQLRAAASKLESDSPTTQP